MRKELKKMFIGIQFKNKKKEFVGKTYNFELSEGEDIPTEGDIVRLMDEDYDLMFYGTRVKIIEVIPQLASSEEVAKVRYLKASMD